jgi:hypothetical protein
MAKVKRRTIPEITPDMTDDKLQVMAAHIAHDLGLSNQYESGAFVLFALQTQRRVARLEALVKRFMGD